jgi:glycosyltransferase involved in cell wall biosynthesis
MEANIPVVTVGLQVYNSAGTLAQAIKSIINQSFQDWELLIHDDGSTDRVDDIIQEVSDPRIRYFKGRENLGRSARLNQSIAVARGKYYAIMDADDVAFPSRLRLQVEYLESHTEVDLVGGAMMVFNGNGWLTGARRVPLSHAEICSRPAFRVNILHPTVMARTQWFRKWPYCEKTIRAEDQVLLYVSHRKSTFANIPDVLVGYREGPLRISKQLRDRGWHTYGICAILLREHRPFVAIGNLLYGLAKTLADVIVILSHSQQIFLRYRATPVSAKEVSDWALVWRLNAPKPRARELSV